MGTPGFQNTFHGSFCKLVNIQLNFKIFVFCDNCIAHPCLVPAIYYPLHGEVLKSKFGVNVLSMVIWPNFIFTYDFCSILLFNQIEAAGVKTGCHKVRSITA